MQVVNTFVIKSQKTFSNFMLTLNAEFALIRMQQNIMKITNPHITTLKPNEIFVFGSNLSGMHGAGAARIAMDSFGAKLGVGVGFTGQCYAFPTKDEKIKTLPLRVVDNFASDFCDVVRANPNKMFLLTAVGCGLAGFSPKQIAPLFYELFDYNVSNISYPIEFVCEALNTGPANFVEIV